MTTTRDYANQHGVSIRTVQRWIQSGQLYAEKHGTRYEIPNEEPKPDSRISEPQERTDSGDLRHYSTKQWAEREGVSQRTIQRWIKDGTLYAEFVGGRYLIPVEVVRTKTEYKGEGEDESEEDSEGEAVTNEDVFAVADLRKEFATLAEAQDYAEPIPVPYLVIRNEYGLYRVIIDYDIVDDTTTQKYSGIESLA